MTYRLISSVAVAFAIFCSAPLVEASWLTDFGHNVANDFRRRNCWPHPFVCPDRYSVREPFVTMVSNGWRRQNLIGDYHFEPGTQELTESARLKIEWIIRQAPRQHRMVFVQQASTAEETAARIEAVHQEVVRLMPEGELPPVVETSIRAESWSAGQIDAIGRKFQETTPDPRLPEASAGEAK